MECHYQLQMLTSHEIDSKKTDFNGKSNFLGSTSTTIPT